MSWSCYFKFGNVLMNVYAVWIHLLLNFTGKSRQRTRSSRNPHGSKVGASAGGGAAGGAGGGSGTDLMDSILNSAGVTTRLQREQLQKQEPSHPSLPPASPTDCDINQVTKESDSLALTAPPVLSPPPSQSVCMDIKGDPLLKTSLANNNNNNNNNNNMQRLVSIISSCF